MGDTGSARHPDSVIELEQGVVDFGGHRALRGVDLRVTAGEVVALLGANGSGKSTLVRSLVGLVPLTHGTIRLFNTPHARFRAWHRIGYVPQRITAASGVPATVREVVASGRLSRPRWLRLSTPADRKAVDAALHTVDLANRARDSVAALSGGQQQRVLIARALAAEPEALILDEPTAGVDLTSQRSFADALRSLVQSGTTILLVAHELGLLEPLIDRAVVLRNGQVVHEGSPPRPVGHHAHLGHDHVHPHADPVQAETRWLE